MTFSLRASSPVSVAASRTAFSAHSALRPRICASERSIATASLVALRSAVLWPPDLSFCASSGRGTPGSPPISIGVAAPRLVPGAIAAMCAA
jgi:hypothetical protein